MPKPFSFICSWPLAAIHIITLELYRKAFLYQTL